jgi:hypothetical protein
MAKVFSILLIFLFSFGNIDAQNRSGDSWVFGGGGEALNIAQNINTYTQFLPGVTHLDQRLAYDWLKTNPATRAQYPVLDNFYWQHFATELEQLRAIDAIIMNLGLRTNMESLEVFNTMWTDASNLNDALDASENIFVEKEKFINTFYLNTLKFGNASLTETEREDIQSLATDCPYISGNAVFKARLLQAYLVLGTHYDDIGVCNSMGVYRISGPSPLDEEENLINGTTKTKNTNFNIYPNPSNGQITIEYKLEKDAIGKIVFVDLLGRELGEIELDAKVSRVTTTLDFTYGVYIAKFIVDNKLLKTDKLIIK